MALMDERLKHHPVVDEVEQMPIKAKKQWDPKRKQNFPCKHASDHRTAYVAKFNFGGEIGYATTAYCYHPRFPPEGADPPPPPRFEDLRRVVDVRFTFKDLHFHRCSIDPRSVFKMNGPIWGGGLGGAVFPGRVDVGGGLGVFGENRSFSF